jgi:hypothetical protein
MIIAAGREPRINPCESGRSDAMVMQTPALQATERAGVAGAIAMMRRTGSFRRR